MKDPDTIIVKQLTYDECLNKDLLALIKLIIAKMADLDHFPKNCSLPLKYDVYDRIEGKLLHSYKYELIDILDSENELRMICSDMKNKMMKELVKSFNDDDIESENESMHNVSDISDTELDENDFTDVSDTESDDGMLRKIIDSSCGNESELINAIPKMIKGKKSIIQIKF